MACCGFCFVKVIFHCLESLSELLVDPAGQVKHLILSTVKSKPVETWFSNALPRFCKA